MVARSMAARRGCHMKHGLFGGFWRVSVGGLFMKSVSLYTLGLYVGDTSPEHTSPDVETTRLHRLS